MTPKLRPSGPSLRTPALLNMTLIFTPRSQAPWISPHMWMQLIRNPFMKISVRSFLAGCQHDVPDPEGGGQHSPSAPGCHPSVSNVKTQIEPEALGVWVARTRVTQPGLSGWAHTYSFRPLLSSHSVHSSFCPSLWAITAPFYPKHRNNCFQKTRLYHCHFLGSTWS